MVTISGRPAVKTEQQSTWLQTAVEAVLPVMVVIASLGLWLAAARAIDIAQISDLGIITALRPASLVALGLLTISFAVTLRTSSHQVPLLILHVLALIFMLYGLSSLVEEQPRFAVSWLHEGFTEYVARNGQIDPALDGRFNWPGFFALSAFMQQVAGVESLTPLLMWAPVLLNVLYLGPLVVLFRATTDNEQLVWLSVWIFYLGNVVGQDYYSPQGLSFFLFLTIVAVLLRWFKTRDTEATGILARMPRAVQTLWTSAEQPNAPASPSQRAGLIAVAVVLFSAIVASHQLTPFFLLAGVMLLSIFKRTSLRTFPVLLSIIILTWISYMAAVFLSGHLGMVTGDVGQINSIVETAVAKRISGSDGHMIVVYGRMILTVFVWGLAFLGGVRRFFTGHRDISFVLFAVAPFGPLAVQDYGGEMLLRVYLFVLPFAAFFIAALVLSLPPKTRNWTAILNITLISALLAGGFFLVRYGNELMDYYTSQEVALVDHMYEIAAPNALLVAANFNLPWKSQDYERYQYFTLKRRATESTTAEIAQLIQDRAYNNSESYLIMTRSQQAYAQLFYGYSLQEWTALVDDLQTSGLFEQVYANADGVILKPSDGAAGGAR